MTTATHHLWIHENLVGEDQTLVKNGQRTAQIIETEIMLSGWRTGNMIGSEETLRARFHVGSRVMREAIRILESRHVGHMRRGPGGGLVVDCPQPDDVAHTLAGYFTAIGVESAELSDADMYLSWMSDMLIYLRSGEGRVGNPPMLPYFQVHMCPNLRAHLTVVAHQVDSLPALDVFQAAIAATRAAQLPASAIAPYPIHGNDPVFATRFGVGAANRVDFLARQLVQEAQTRHRAGANHLMGTEDELCERHAVGRTVLRQALRVLETYGLIETLRGRNGGIALRKPSARGAIERVLSFLSAEKTRTSDIVAAARLIEDILSVLAVSRWSPATTHAIPRQRTADAATKDDAMLTNCRLAWDAAGNRILALYARCLAAYSNRALSSAYGQANVETADIRAAFDARLWALGHRDLECARNALQHRETLLRHLFRNRQPG